MKVPACPDPKAVLKKKTQCKLEVGSLAKAGLPVSASTCMDGLGPQCKTHTVYGSQECNSALHGHRQGQLGVSWLRKFDHIQEAAATQAG